jgi:hypothetical protein
MRGFEHGPERRDGRGRDEHAELGPHCRERVLRFLGRDPSPGGQLQAHVSVVGVTPHSPDEIGSRETIDDRRQRRGSKARRVPDDGHRRTRLAAHGHEDDCLGRRDAEGCRLRGDATGQ